MMLCDHAQTCADARDCHHGTPHKQIWNCAAALVCPQGGDHKPAICKEVNGAQFKELAGAAAK